MKLKIKDMEVDIGEADLKRQLTACGYRLETVPLPVKCGQFVMVKSVYDDCNRQYISHFGRVGGAYSDGSIEVYVANLILIRATDWLVLDTAPSVILRAYQELYEAAKANWDKNSDMESYRNDNGPDFARFARAYCAIKDKLKSKQ